MTEKSLQDEPLVVRGKLEIPYKQYVGAVASKFLIELRDNKRIFGTRCPECKRVYVPSRSICPKCVCRMDEWVEVSDKGTVLTYSVVHYKEPTHPVEPPFVYGIIQLDGADTGIVHFIAGVDQDGLRVGMRVQAVFSEERKGNMLDIKHFKPL
jgi:uncharacterized OB-fold protein